MKKHENKTLTKKQKIVRSSLLYGGVGSLLITFGVIGGILLGQNVFIVKKDYSKISINDNEDNFDATYEKFKKTSKAKYFDSFSHVELINIALLKLKEVDHFYTISEGMVNAAGVKQSIASTYIKNNHEYFEENFSYSKFVKAANRFYQNEESINWFKGKYVSLTEGNYQDAKLTEYTFDEFDTTWGRTMDRGCIYIISSKSYLKGSVDKNSDGTYAINVYLHPTYGVLRYVKQMKMTGGLSQEPIFHEVHLTFNVDDELNLKSFVTDETYDVHMVIDAKNSKASLTQTYYYEERNIPSIDEKANYER